MTIFIYSKANGMHHRVIDEHNKISKTVLWYMGGTEPHTFNQELIDKLNKTNCIVSYKNNNGLVYK